MKNIANVLLLLFVVQSAIAQEYFIPRGKITFEKSINMSRTLDENSWYSEEMKDKMATYRKSNWDYQFNDTHSIFKEAPKNMNANSMFFFSNDNTGQMYTNFKDNNRVFSKSLSGVEYLLKDSIPKLDWKIQSEIRTIAGYETRKATAVFNDTITVVAFYTDQILTQGGPEGFTGLPGMILGLAIPRYFTTWFATKVEVIPENVLAIQAPTKGQKAENERDYNRMLEVFQRWLDDKDKPTPAEIRRRIFSLTL